MISLCKQWTYLAFNRSNSLWHAVKDHLQWDIQTVLMIMIPKLFIFSFGDFISKLNGWMSNLLTTGSNAGIAFTTDSSSRVFNTSKNGDKSVKVSWVATEMGWRKKMRKRFYFFPLYMNKRIMTWTWPGYRGRELCGFLPGPLQDVGRHKNDTLGKSLLSIQYYISKYNQWRPNQS